LSPWLAVLREAYERETATTEALVDAIREALPYTDEEGEQVLERALLVARGQGRATLAMLERAVGDSRGGACRA
jgi:hypothetical protein